MQVLKTKFNPIVILGIWTILMVIVTPILMYNSNIGASGGEQKPLTTLATMINVTVYGWAVLSILTPCFYIQWFKKNWWFSFIILFTIIPVIILVYGKIVKSSYSFSETTKEINGITILTKTEYYSGGEFEKVRSISYWRNGRKDSTWQTFSLDGKIIKQLTYHNDTLLK